MKNGGNTMYCYRGIKYDAKTLKSNAKKSKAKKSDEITYRGIKHDAIKSDKSASKVKSQGGIYRGVKHG